MNQQIAAIGRKVHLVSLGCARNRVDAEVMLGDMVQRGWVITDQPEQADAIVVNTCGFIGPAKEESIDTILECAQLKVTNPSLKLVVTGCLTQRYKTQLATGMPEVDLFIGTDEFRKIGDLIDQPAAEGASRIHARRTNYLYEGELPKLNTLSAYSAYVKVAEGCQHQCSFCIIPAIRGRLRSRPIESVVKEVEKLAEQGVKEINLIAQDLAAYGRDLGQDMLLDLLKSLESIEGIRWIRLLYMYPEFISDDFLAHFAQSEKLVKYLDIPMQHGSDTVLQRMKRNVTQSQLLEVISRVRQSVPGISIRTSVMVGFPGETDEEFEELLSFVTQAKFDHLGCFTYSQEEGTVAGRMPDQVDEAIKQERLDRIMMTQQEISAGRMQSFVGQKLPVLVLGTSQETELLLEGRIATQAPEVDGVVLINDGPAKIGEIQWVEITESHEYDLLGRVIDQVST